MMDRGGHKHKITREQRNAILAAFVERGEAIAQSLANELGLAPDYAIRLARAMGVA